MAKKLTDIESKKKAVARAGRCEAYANKVGMMFSETVNSILSLHKSVPELKDGQMFSFDDESVNKQNQVTALLRRLHSNVVTAIRKDMGIEWDKANDEADSMIVRMFGEEVTKNQAFAGWMERNHGALNAFASRSEKGMKLSDRIWRDVKQLREEMEVAMTVSIGEGESASSMSRKVKQYLNDPDLMFRRFRYKNGVDKDGNPVYGMKWKKRVKDEVTGKYRFIDYDKDSYKTGRGVYKSASKNAMRVTRTETNIAYRRADNKRWLNMDFVLGYRIKIAHNHPEKDICDTLQGDYPKDFVFDGWHPQCFCYCTPILIDEEEMVKMMKAKRDGKEYTPKGKEIKDVPANFKKWVEDNRDRIEKARDEGKEPYFLAHNKEVVDGILNEENYENYEENRKLYDKLKADNNYTDVEFDEKTGGLKATHKDHNLKSEGATYELKAQEVGMKYGHSVILESELSTILNKRFTEGSWDGQRFEVAGCETCEPNNILRGIRHSAHKRTTEIAIVYLCRETPIYELDRAVERYKGLPSEQFVRFKKIVFMHEDRIIHDVVL